MTEERKEAKQILTERFGEERVKTWQKQYVGRDLHIIEVEDKIGVLSPITARAVAQFTRALTTDGQGLDIAARSLIQELWLDGDIELVENEDYFISAMMQVQNLVELKKSRVLKL